MNLELQQRAVEYNAVLRKHEQLRDGLFEQMPAVELKSSNYANTSSSNLDDGGLLGSMGGVGDENQTEEDRKREQERAKQEAAKTLIDIFSDDMATLGVPAPVAPISPSAASKPDTTKSTHNDMDIFNILDQPANPQPSKNPLNDLDSIFSGQAAVPSTSNTNALDDLLGFGGGSSSQPSSHQATPQMNPNDLLGLFGGSSVPVQNVSPAMTNGLNSLMGGGKKSSSFTAYEKNDLKMVFETAPGKPSSLEQCYVQVKVDNLSISNFVKDFEFSAAVPKTMQIQITPPTNNSMQPLESLSLMIAIANPKKVYNLT